MIDFILGAVVGGLAVFLFYHFGPQASKAFLVNFEQRFQQMVSQAFNDALTRLEQVVDTRIAASDTGPAVDAEATAAVGALADKLSAPAAEPQPEG